MIVLIEVLKKVLDGNGAFGADLLTVPLHESRVECGTLRVSGCLPREHRRRLLAQ
jgi:hypothetical protein